VSTCTDDRKLLKNEKSPERRLGAFLVLLSVRATRGGCPYRFSRRGSLAFVKASSTFIPSNFPGVYLPDTGYGR
jgi:hypothetical protein